MAEKDALRQEALSLHRARQPVAALDRWARAVAAGLDASADSGERWACRMLLGQYEEAWRISDRVLAARPHGEADRAGVPAHERFVWTGGAAAGKTVLVRCYHGLGDTIQFIRFAERLDALGCEVAVQAQPALVPLLSQVRGIRTLLPLDWTTQDPPHDLAIEIMETAHALRVTLADLPGRNPYIEASAPLVAERAAGMPRDGRLRVGIAWAAGDWDERRTVPLAALQPLAALPVHYFSVQRGEAEAELNRGIGPFVANPDEHSPDVAATAALIANLDLVITVDTMVAHLAGAMGRPVWLLLHCDADWRWLIDREDSPWYPTMRLFRQQQPGDWKSPVDRVTGLLSNRTGFSRESRPVG
jgi:hypothetical protein